MTDGVLARVRQPEYTGENRCVPCTLANCAIAGVLAGAVGYGWLTLGGGSLAVAGLLGVAVLVVSGLSIWLRGYLVPGTPELTKRYFPDWLLAKFDKAPDSAAGGFTGEESEESEHTVESYDGPTDPETLLLDGGVVEPCADVDDLCLADGFREAWHARMTTLRDTEAEREELAEQLDVEAESVTFEEHAGGAFTAFVDGAQVGQWESRAALVADLAAGRELPAWLADWEQFPTQVRSQLLGGLRIFLETCPDCEGPVVAGQETVESCCRSYDVVAASCDECGSRLLEVPYDDGMAA